MIDSSQLSTNGQSGGTSINLVDNCNENSSLVGNGQSDESSTNNMGESDVQSVLEKERSDNSLNEGLKSDE